MIPSRSPEARARYNFKRLGLKKRRKIEAVEYKGGVCTKCKGVFDPCVYDFHHRDPSIKEGRASVFLNWSLERIKIELDKCDLLCANCHRLEHYQPKESTMNAITDTATTSFQPVAAEGAKLTDEQLKDLLKIVATDEPVDGQIVGYVVTDTETAESLN